MLNAGENNSMVSVYKKSLTQDLRVLAVIPGDEADRSSMVFARRQVSALNEAGVATRIFFLSSRTSPKVLLQELRRFRETIREFDPHIVHSHFGTVTSLFCAIATKRPLVISFRGSDLNPTRNVSSLRSLMGRLFSQASMLRARHAICVSPQLRDRLWLKSRPVSVIFDGIDLSLFQPMPRDEARRRLGWSQEAKLIFFNLGGRPVGKRLPLAESAVSVARRTMPDVDLVAVSKVDPERIPLYMNACDCLLLTSEWEGSPTVVKEALACNLPVVSVDVGDVTELLREVYPSTIVPADAEAIGHALIDILQGGIRSNGRSRACDMSEEITTARVIAIYEEILTSHSGHVQRTAPHIPPKPASYPSEPPPLG